MHISVKDRVTPNYNRFSNWNRLKRSQAYIIRFVYNLKVKKIGGDRRTGPIKKDELDYAECLIFRCIQSEAFKDEISALQNNPINPIPKTSSIYNLSPFLDDKGVLRHKTRLDVKFGIIFGVREAIIMTRKHKVTELILLSYHMKYHHRNHETVVNEVRKDYVIPKLRTTLKSVRRLCQYCANAAVIPKVPEMAPLPKSRLAYMTRPFSFTGIDFFGNMEVVVGRRIEKRWGALFTCLTIRAVHIEIASSLNTDSCIMCIRNFISRRGCPIEMYSDNGTNFHGADNVLPNRRNCFRG